MAPFLARGRHGRRTDRSDVSTTGDPAGAYHRYAFLVSSTKLNDYPKFGVWPDGYYMSVNQFAATSLTWAGAGAVVFERAAMLTGAPASLAYFDLLGVNPGFGGMLPSDLDGAAPPAGAPNVFAEVDDSLWLGDPVDTMRLFDFHVDWTTPANSTFGPPVALPVASFNPLCPSTSDCIPQPGVSSSQYLDDLGDRLMYRLQYRNFGGYRTLVVNHSVDAGSGVAGVRWYELRDSGGSWVIHQQGTYSPDSVYRWMGSAAMDAAPPPRP